MLETRLYWILCEALSTTEDHTQPILKQDCNKKTTSEITKVTTAEKLSICGLLVVEFKIQNRRVQTIYMCVHLFRSLKISFSTSATWFWKHNCFSWESDNFVYFSHTGIPLKAPSRTKDLREWDYSFSVLYSIFT